jgi:LysR family hydrogen peroxide-inducible transcriptional activator
MIRPTLRQLEYAVAVADQGHFSRAAELVRVSQPGLSSQVQELERRLGVDLFERSARQVRLTPAGREVVRRARDVLRQVDELGLIASLFQGTVRGQLRLAAIPTAAPYLLPTLARALRQHWTEAHLELHELQTAVMVEAIERGDVDLGLLALPFSTASLHVEPVAEEPFLLALPEGHPLAGKDPVQLGVLAELPVLLLEDGHCLRDHTQNACDIAGNADRHEIRAASLATLVQMVAGGDGVTLLPASALSVESRAGTGIVARAFVQPAPGRTLAFAWRRSDPRSEMFLAAVRAIQDRIVAATQIAGDHVG